MGNSGNRHRGWHSRGYIPHFDQAEAVQSVTFRLADSMPAERLRAWEAELQCDATILNRQLRESRRRRKIEAYLDAGHGECLLRRPVAASIVESALLFFDGFRYRLLAWVVMPNHVHCAFEMCYGHPLGEVVHSWKSYTSTEINRQFGREGQLWFPDYWDRYIRDSEHLAAVVNYIHANPVKAHLVERAEDWPFSSARRLTEWQP